MKSGVISGSLSAMGDLLAQFVASQQAQVRRERMRCLSRRSGRRALGALTARRARGSC